MTIKEKILEDTKTAIKNKDASRVQTLRFLQAAIKNKEIELRPNVITSEQVTQVIKKQIKQAQESLEGYEKASGYQAQADAEKYNISVLKKYLPESLSEEEIESIVQVSIKEIKPESIKDMGRVMKLAKEKSKGAADGKVLSEKIRAQLENL